MTEPLDSQPTGTGPTGPSAPHGRAAKPARSPASPDPKRPYHLGAAIGLSTGIYAASLLVAARLQIDADRALIHDRTPVEAAISALGDHHDWMDDRLDEARAGYAAGATAYDDLRMRLAAMDKRLASLNSVVASVERLGNSISTTLELPVGRPIQGSSGGSSSRSTGSGSGSGGTAKPPAPAPKPPPPPPPTSGNTGASGG